MGYKYVFKKWDQSNEPARCWYCQANTLFFITDKKKGEEFFCCPLCALGKHKIKRLKGLLKKYPIRTQGRKEKPISKPNPLIKNIGKLIIQTTLGVENG